MVTVWFSSVQLLPRLVLWGSKVFLNWPTDQTLQCLQVLIRLLEALTLVILTLSELNEHWHICYAVQYSVCVCVCVQTGFKLFYDKSSNSPKAETTTYPQPLQKADALIVGSAAEHRPS